MLKPNPNLLADNAAAGYGAPILYLPMKDSATAHINEGTGGNFVQNGTLDTASRGANQDNCKASYFDGVNDYLSKAVTISGSKIMTLSVNVKYSTSGKYVFKLNGSNTSRCQLYVSNGYITFNLYDAAGQNIYSAGVYTKQVTNIDMNVSLGIDLATPSKCIFTIDGIVYSATTIINTSIGAIDTFLIGTQNVGADMFGGSIGELYFDTKYIDLATSNPFWDKDTNRPKPVRQVIRETGITPLIAMPLDASNAGKNYGTGGDFTANSAPYVGARGASEFWARSIAVGVNDGNSLVKGVNYTDSKSLSIFMCFNTISTSINTLINIFDALDYGVLIQTTPYFQVVLKDNLAITAYERISSVPFDGEGWQCVLFSLTLDTINSDKMYINNVNQATSATTFRNAAIKLSNSIFNIGARGSAKTYTYDGFVGSLYFTTDYIDFSQEVNRNKFVDQLGYPKDLKAQIDAGVIPNPLIYLPFDEPTNLGKNLGTGGNFTVNGTVTAGADFSL